MTPPPSEPEPLSNLEKQAFFYAETFLNCLTDEVSDIVDHDLRVLIFFRVATISPNYRLLDCYYQHNSVHYGRSSDISSRGSTKTHYHRVAIARIRP